ncbi:excinuclease ABC subunit UvrC [Acuticoccus sp. I52.16.1]|uniref:excinuclease ABC subunit UvrC n=1 Tax=Acuticoccus sp. I52.16.1 TaxID=2928472 RepID=UPI001FD03E4B|nr:excinuclease ABC subunit UvrC [Acuticoccus sp. I52.16.1]UOM35996.1 excinuclease ABC subunit UvrC [Acuticoccus sp. I52.16.1]
MGDDADLTSEAFADAVVAVDLPTRARETHSSAERRAAGIEEVRFRRTRIEKTGFDLIAETVKRLPNAPGVYRMLDDAGDVLYVGKARSLKKRVVSYSRPTGLSSRLMSMVNRTVAMEFVTTQTETEALLLEANLIKRFRPRYNVLLRDDKSFPYILLTGDHEAPQIIKHRGAHSRKGDYYGPFASAGAVDRTINALQKAFLIRSCTDAVYEQRTRPCLLYQIKRCSGPCTKEIAIDDYAGLVGEAKAFLTGKSKAIRKRLGAEMEEAAEALEFERAARIRDRLAALSHVDSHQGINTQGIEEADVFAVHQEGGETCVQVFFFRTGQNWGNRAYYPRDEGLEADAVLEAFLAQFYDDKPVPRMILLSHEVPDRDLLALAFSEKAARKVEVAVPQRGAKKELVDHAAANAREALGRRLAEKSSQGKLLAGLGETFGLERTPRRIEVYDNSHIMGTNAVGGMIVAGPEGFSKPHYRKFNIKSEDLTPGDDFGMMKEVLTRRFSRLLKEAPREAPDGEAVTDDDGADEGTLGPWPDLVLIDGGAGQLTAAHAVLDALGITDVPLVGVAKGVDRDAGREEFHRRGHQPFRLPPRDPVLYFIQRLRDEAHRFAIGAHRAKRKKALTANPLDDIAGIGAARKRALLKHFGTAKAVAKAGIDDLVAVDGISESVAKRVYDHFHAEHAPASR